MIRVLLCAAIFATGIVGAAWGQDWYAYTPEDPDDLEIRASSEGHFAEIHYDNSASLSSTSGTHVLIWEGEEITVRIEVGGPEVDGAEIIRVDTPPHLMALPDYMEVPDGEAFIVQIVRAMF